MNHSNTSRLLLLTLFDWELASSQTERNEIKALLQELRHVARDLEQHVLAADEPKTLHVIKQKQQIIYQRRRKMLALLKGFYQRRRKLQS